MSILLGAPGDRWSLSNAVDALAESARAAGTPGLLWIAGALYPSLHLTVNVVTGFLAIVAQLADINLPVALEARDVVTVFTSGYVNPGGDSVAVLVLFLLIVARLIVGLAKISDPEREPRTDGEAEGESASGDPVGKRRLGTAWEAGKGLGLAAFGLWLMLTLLLFAAMLALVIPIVGLVTIAGLSDFPAVLAGLLIPVVILLVAYATVLMVINQLAPPQPGAQPPRSRLGPHPRLATDPRFPPLGGTRHRGRLRAVGVGGRDRRRHRNGLGRDDLPATVHVDPPVGPLRLRRGGPRGLLGPRLPGPGGPLDGGSCSGALRVLTPVGGGERTRARTWDLLVKSQLLYQLSYAPVSSSRPATGAGMIPDAGGEERP